MSTPHWRTYSVFTQELVVNDGKQPAEEPVVEAKTGPKGRTRKARASKRDATSPALVGFTPYTSVTGASITVYGAKDGSIRLVNADWTTLDFQAHRAGLIGLQYFEKLQVVASCGIEDLETGVTTIKFWQADMISKEGRPICHATLNIFNDKFPPTPVTSFSVLNDLTQIAVGLSNGALILMEGSNLMKDTVKREYSLLKKKGSCVTHVFFHPDETVELKHTHVVLYVVSMGEVFTYFTRHRSARNAGDRKPVSLDVFQDDTEVNDATVNSAGQLVLGTPKAVYYYDRDEKGVCFGFTGDKVAVRSYKNYLVLVQQLKTRPNMNSVNIYDLKNKFIAFSGKFESSLSITPGRDGDIYVATAGSKLWKLVEKDLPTKMETFFRKNLYPIAISVAKSSNLEPAMVVDIYQMYGDHLYEKKDFDNAMIQYVQTINFVEPSYIIRKFLEAQQIFNLTRYLEALHHNGRANTDHTTLLLNCFTKLKDVTKLGAFIRDENLKFDVKTAIKVCRGASYFEQALFLARKHKQHDSYIRIQLNDMANYTATLNYIWSLPFNEANHFAQEYGQELLEHLEVETTELFIFLCTDYTSRPLTDDVADATLSSSTSNNSGLGEAKSSVHLGGGEEGHNNNNNNNSSSSSSTSNSNSKAKPEDFIHFFVGRTQFLEQFLESITSNPGSSPVIINTLLELYLRQDGDGKTDAPQPPQASKAKKIHRNHHKIMNLLKSQHGAYDLDHALVLTKMYGFEKGTVHLYGKLKLYNEIVAHHMERDNFQQVRRACKKYGDHDPQLWNQALVYFAGKKEPCETEIIEVLENIELHNLLPPLMVIQMLAQNPHKPLSVVRDYMIRMLLKEQSTIVADEREINRLQDETDHMKTEIDRLQTKATIFQGIRCHNCTDPLQLPAIHFLCMHSFHDRCIDNDLECPECAPEFKKVKEIKSSLQNTASHHDVFFKQLDETTDGFSTVAEYFGRGIFDANEEPEPEIVVAEADDANKSTNPFG